VAGDVPQGQAPDGFVYLAELLKAQITELQKLTRLQREHLDLVRDSRDATRDLRDELALLRAEIAATRQRMELDAAERRLIAPAVARTISR
jgi:hypothetical protein